MSNSSSRWWLLGVIVALWAIFLSVPNPELDWETEVLASAQRYMQQKTTTPLSGLVVAVTGSTSGIGLEITLILQKLGATIWAIGRNPQKLERLFGQYDNVKLVIADLMDLASVANASQHILEHSDTLDVLINNAGIGMPDKPWENPTTKQGYDVTFGGTHFLLYAQTL